ncbi:hypothetical protein [Undibacterium flavidum]|uniref:KTSC domain-containing protein n=1 Tax=Undibacterium flavidum TaxID=2762297 RepID=A0ABR6Y935_9BURK|nr:hypothetical protein [Undibacterium flavidum]MBC3873115.1 hypothetical protein [Undibacterium flavidum]
MDMKRINAGKLRAIGYDTRERMLRVELGRVDIIFGYANESKWAQG